MSKSDLISFKDKLLDDSSICWGDSLPFASCYVAKHRSPHDANEGSPDIFFLSLFPTLIAFLILAMAIN